MEFTLAEAVDVLDPPLTESQLRQLIRALRLQPSGARQINHRGRPHSTYRSDEIMQLHAALTPWLGNAVR